MALCSVCNETVSTNDKSLICFSCKKHSHIKCLNSMGKEDHDAFSRSGMWNCQACSGTTITNKGDEHTESKDCIDNEESVGSKKIYKGQKCGSCHKGFSHNAHKIFCDKCSNWFHIKCKNLNYSDYLELVDKEWICNECSKIKTSSQSISLADVMAAVEGIAEQIKVTNKKISVIENSLTDYSDIIMENNEKINSLNAEIKNLSNQMSIINLENIELKKKLKESNIKCNQIEQLSFQNDIEIHGIPKCDNENLLSTVTRLGQVLNSPINEDSISDIYRLRTPPGISKPPIIVVSFVKRMDKFNVLKLSREKRTLNIRDIGIIDGEQSKIYINERLTSENKKILRLAKEAKTKKGYKYVWTRGGRIMIRKGDNEPVTFIKSTDDIDQL